MAEFTNAFGSPIREGQLIQFMGAFFDKMPQSRRTRLGYAHIVDNMLYFVAWVDGVLRPTGLYWELDGEPCYDLV